MSKRNVYYAYMDVNEGKTEIFSLSTGEIYTIDGYDVYANINQKSKSDCYISRVYTFSKMFPGGTLCAHNYKKMDTPEPLTYTLGKCTFRSFYALFGGQPLVKNLADMYPQSERITHRMHLYLTQFGDVTEHPIQYTLAYQAQKQFYADIADELWEEHKKNHHYYYDVQTYRDMYSGNKSGTMLIYGDTASYHEDIAAFDKKSAYPSVMVNDDVFPIGRIKFVGTCGTPNDTEQWILRHIHNKKWVKIVFDGKINGLEKWYDADMDVTALEYWNIFTCHRMGLWRNLQEALCVSNYRMYDCTITGYLHTAFRDKIIEYYNEKERYPKCSVTRFMRKTCIDMLYGKGLQDFAFKDIYEIQKHFRGRGKNYLTPEMSMHCVARVEYELLDAYAQNESVYCDTDGIKVKNTEKSNDYFNRKNNDILYRNNIAGYDTNIGIWDSEGHIDRLIIFNRKCYVAETDGKIDATIAGVPEDIKKWYIGKIQCDKIQYMRVQGFSYPVREYKITDGNIQQDYRRDDDGNILLSHLRGDLTNE